MDYEEMNIDWNADPNAPEPEVTVAGSIVSISFFLNYFLYEQFKEGDKGILTFRDCRRYSFNSMNNEGYFGNKYRFKQRNLPWGEFYLLKNSNTKFPNEVLVDKSIEEKSLKHYIFFFRSNIFECLADEFDLNFQLC